jgi:hypothetical protein
MDLRLKGTTLAISVVTMALTAVAGALAPSAQAASGPVITSGSCSESLYFFQCQITWAGGTDPSTVQWTAAANSAIGGSLTNPSTHSSRGDGNCVPNTFYEVKATVTDAHGLSASTYLGGHCDG